MDIGSELRNARLRRGLTLEQVADRTKIRHGQLSAIERNEFDRLPGTIYVRGFLKAYAREVGLNPEEIAAQFSAAFDQKSPPEVTDQPSLPSSTSERSSPAWMARLAPSTLVAGALLLAWMYASYVAMTRTSSPVTGRENAERVRVEDATGRAANRGVGTSGAGANAAGSRGEVAGAMDVEIQATGPCWVAAAVDGKRVIGRLMGAGERQRFHAQETITLRIGDPAAFTFSVNGAPGRTLGRPREPVTITMTTATYLAFVVRDAGR